MQDNTNSTRNLDALRIIAACAVVILHYSDYVKDTQVGQFMVAHTWHFNLFVDLFFVVSGFVIASQYLGRVGDPMSIGRFLWRRLARIYPLHLATLAFYVALALALHFGIARTDNTARYPLSDLPAQLLLLHAIDGARLTFNFPSWSLSAEMFCYVLFPLIAITVTRNKALIIALVVLPALANSAYAAATGTGSWADWINKGGAFRALPAFNLGVACYLFRDQIARWPVIPGAVTALLAAFILAGSWLPEMADLIVIYAIATLAIQSDCTCRDTLLTTFGFDRWSSLTYSCYMLHIPVATIVLTFGARDLAPHLPGGRLTLIPVAIVVLAIASLASLRWFENPMRRYLNDAFDRRIGTRRPVAVAARPDTRR
ncbi:acyltransferase [Rhodopseudomonas sp. P2A-2r]|uniref:acyltransferase family protein n=1 Tax=Rhodopseudomonas sp. P2A-2r TaxID=2991972 RepID=UPI0022346A1F|nr:acyltransferase [Rhodopseudomonas sp. P2A-2r]UZE47493.1 acyltransferase [Rhodopseudomonas sp. P2A-2r]